MLIKFLLILSAGYAVKSLHLESLDNYRDIYLDADAVWTWDCTDKGCQKKPVMDKSTCEKDNSKKCNETVMVRPVIGEEVCNLLCPPGNLWPQPNGEMHMSNSYVLIDTNNIVLNIQPREKRTGNDGFNITKAADVFLQRFYKLGKSVKNKSLIRGLIINLQISNPSNFKYETDADESYTLNIGQTADNMVNVTVDANTFLGIRHGLETLSQLLVTDSVTGNVASPTEFSITDRPAFTHRGITIDTARNFISVPALLRTLDAMASVKLNTLHWHITDSHSFPFFSRSNPLFSKYGAYSPEKVYSEEDIQLVVDYARLRGIRVVPELDLPAHVGEGWQAAPGTVVCFNAQPWTEYCVEPPCGQIDPTSDKVYEVLKGLYSDLNRLFDADHFHMGGDEVNLHCWNSTQIITDNMEKQGLRRTKDGFHQLWSNFQEKAKGLLKQEGGMNKKLVLWTSSLTEGDLDHYLNNTEYIIQVWTKGDDHSIINLLKKGFKIIMSNYDALYFDCGFGAWVGTGNNWCSPYIPWQKVYENTPNKIVKKLGLQKEYEKLVLGSEAALWTEQADDSSLDNRLWPRGAALAESLWSPGRTWQTAEKRYLLQRDRFVKRGISADTVEPEWCRQNQGFCYL